jgi:hypothetical protein
MENYDERLNHLEMIKFCKEVYFFKKKEEKNPHLHKKYLKNESNINRIKYIERPKRMNISINNTIKYRQRNIEREFILNQTSELNKKGFDYYSRFPISKN